ncbi:hypothetical protein KP509_37G066800 [Ceratopteris richardii]|uniref:Ribosomal protein L14 n=2 Tax=Ceratopteris richardii TaxID=49495 RepID=A0A8T2Q8M6_CERRI|nr:hypothetical protein KP509_37G066800 [Ceratopteris richardii]
MAFRVLSSRLSLGHQVLRTDFPIQSHIPAYYQQCRTFVQLKTKLNVADNSGAKIVECIKVMNKTRLARLGDTIIASVKEVVGRGKVKKGEVVYCVVVRARMPRARSDGSEVRFDDNAAVIINKQGEPIGTRIMGPVCHELRRRKMVKVLSLAEHVA